MLQYKRVLLKLSGEALAGEDGYGINPEMLERYAEEIKEARDMGAQIALVIGGGGIFSGVCQRLLPTWIVCRLTTWVCSLR